MSRSIARYSPSRRYALFTLAAFVAAIACGWAATPWGFAHGNQFSAQLSWIAASVLFALTGSFTLLLARRPSIEIFDNYMEMGSKRIFWAEVQRVDRVVLGKGQPWAAPLLLRMRLAGGEDILVFHAGDLQSCVGLLRHIYRYSRAALLDDLTYSEFWGEPPVPQAQAALPRPRLLRSDDEEEVERLFQRLRAGGRLDDAEPTSSGYNSSGYNPDRINDPRGSDEL